MMFYNCELKDGVECNSYEVAEQARYMYLRV